MELILKKGKDCSSKATCDKCFFNETPKKDDGCLLNKINTTFTCIYDDVRSYFVLEDNNGQETFRSKLKRFWSEL